MSESPKPADALRTLPERAFRARAGLVAGVFCLVCCGLAVRLLFLQVLGGGWYTDRALGQQLRDTVVPRRPGTQFTVPTAFCWPPTAAAGPCGPAPGDAGEKITLAAHGLAEILALDEAAPAGKIQRPPLQ